MLRRMQESPPVLEELDMSTSFDPFAVSEMFSNGLFVLYILILFFLNTPNFYNIISS